ADIFERNRPDVVLQLLELDDDVGRDDVGTGREQLPELDEGRAELVEHLPQAPAAVRGHLRAVAADPRKEVGQAMALEEVAEAVLDRDLGDLGESADVARGRTGRHAAQSDTGLSRGVPSGSSDGSPAAAASAACRQSRTISLRTSSPASSYPARFRGRWSSSIGSPKTRAQESRFLGDQPNVSRPSGTTGARSCIEIIRPPGWIGPG